MQSDFPLNNISQDAGSPVKVIHQKTIKYMENMWGQEVRPDYKKKDYEREYNMHPRNFSNIRDPMLSGSLPYATTPRLYFNRNDRMLPTETRDSSIAKKMSLENSSPWYTHYWPVVETWPILPSRGDITQEPMYNQRHTRSFTKTYKKSWK